MVYHGSLNGRTVSGTAAKWIADIEPGADTAVLLTFVNTVFRGQPFCTEHRYGKGCAIYIGSHLIDAGTERQILQYALDGAGVSRPALPENVQCLSRGNVVFLLNFNDDEVSFPLPVPGTCDPAGFVRGDTVTMPERSVLRITV